MKKLILALVAMFGRKPRTAELIENGALAYVRSWQAPSHRRQRARSLQTLQQLLREGDVHKARRWLDELPAAIAFQAVNGFDLHSRRTGETDFWGWVEANVGCRLDPNPQASTLWLFVKKEEQS